MNSIKVEACNDVSLLEITTDKKLTFKLASGVFLFITKKQPLKNIKYAFYFI